MNHEKIFGIVIILIVVTISLYSVWQFISILDKFKQDTRNYEIDVQTEVDVLQLKPDLSGSNQDIGFEFRVPLDEEIDELDVEIPGEAGMLKDIEVKLYLIGKNKKDLNSPSYPNNYTYTFSDSEIEVEFDKPLKNSKNNSLTYAFQVDYENNFFKHRGYRRGSREIDIEANNNMLIRDGEIDIGNAESCEVQTTEGVNITERDDFGCGIDFKANNTSREEIEIRYENSSIYTLVIIFVTILAGILSSFIGFLLNTGMDLVREN